MASPAYLEKLKAQEMMSMELMAYAASVSDQHKSKPQKDESLLSMASIDLTRAENILIIGGGGGPRESILLKRLKLDVNTLASVICIDPQFPGRIRQEYPSCKLVHVPRLLHQAIDLVSESVYDCVICLGASRYFKNPSSLLSNVFRRIPHGGIAIIDYLSIGPVKYAVNQQIRSELVKAYLLSPDNMWSLINDLTSLAIAVGRCSKELVSITSNSTLFAHSGDFPLQQLLYDYFLPCWYREGASHELCKALLIWSILCNSPPGMTPSSLARWHSSMSMDPIEIISPRSSNTITVLSRRS